MFDQKKEAMEFAINFTVLEVAMLSDYAKCIVLLRIFIKERGIWRNKV